MSNDEDYVLDSDAEEEISNNENETKSDKGNEIVDENLQNEYTSTLETFKKAPSQTEKWLKRLY